MKKLYKYLLGRFTASKSERMHKRYMRWLATYAPDYASGNIDLMRVFTTHDGINFYLPKDLLMLTNERMDKIREAQLAYAYGMTAGELSETLKELLEAAKELPFDVGANNKDKIKRYVNSTQAKLGDIIYRVESIKTERVILEMALLLFFIEGENPYTVNDLTQKRKRALVESNDELRAFFLSTTVVILKQSISNENNGSKQP